MYSVVLTAALLVSSGATDCCWGGGCGWGGGRSWGGGYGGGCGCYGGYGIGYGGSSYYGGGCGCYGGFGGYGYASIGYGGYGYAGYGYASPYYAYAPMSPYAPIMTASTTDPNRAYLTVNLPENAKLTVDGKATQQTTSQRQFVSPSIQPGQEIVYTLVAESTQNGQLVSQTQNVTLRPGQQLPVTFNFSATSAETNR